MEKGGFLLHSDYWPQLRRLSIEQRGELLTAIYAHVLLMDEIELDPATGMAYAFIIDRIDRDREKYLAKCEKLRENSEKGGIATRAKYSQMLPNGTVNSQFEGIRTPIRTPTPIPNNTLFDKESIGADKLPAHARGLPSQSRDEPVDESLTQVRLGKESLGESTGAAPQPSPAHKRGEYGYVRLTDVEYEKLIADLGESEARRVIAYVDESAAATGNKNKWKNWNLVLRKASREGWGKKYNGREAEKNDVSIKREYSGAGFRESV